MRVFLNGQSITLGPRDLIGQGGEASVYGHAGLALKLYHEPEDRAARDALQTRFRKLRAFPSGLPNRVLAPIGLVTDGRNRPLGFAMRRALGAQDLFLTKPGPKEAFTLFLGLARLLTEVHARSVVVGDLNDGNVLVDDTGIYLIDADSMQFGSFPCLVAHERTLAPELYGIDLSAGPKFSVGTDWYAFCVLFFQKLFGVHPFGGVHKKLGTLLRRIEARHSVLRDDVQKPKATPPFELLPDSMLDYFHRTLEQGERRPPAAGLLEIELASCSVCGLEHARTACPACRRHGVLSARPVLHHRGRCLARVLFQTRGRILAVETAGGLRYLIEEDGRLMREDRRVLPLPTFPVDEAATYSLGRSATWIAMGERASLVAPDGLQQTLSIDTAMDQPLFGGAHGHGAFVRDGILETTALTRRLGTIVPAEARIFAGTEIGYGFYRIGRLTHHFLFQPGRGGLLSIPLPPIIGQLRSVRATFDGTDVLVEIAVVAAGKAVHRIALVDHQGRVVASHEGVPEESPVLAHGGRPAMFGRRLLVPTDNGLLLANVDEKLGRFLEGRIFTETEPFLSAKTDLYPGPKGSVYLVNQREFLQLELLKEGV